MPSFFSVACAFFSRVFASSIRPVRRPFTESVFPSRLTRMALNCRPVIPNRFRYSFFSFSGFTPCAVDRANSVRSTQPKSSA